MSEQPTEPQLEVVETPADEAHTPEEEKPDANADIKELKEKVESLTTALGPLVHALTPKPVEVKVDSEAEKANAKLDELYTAKLSQILPKEKLDSMTLEAKEGAYQLAMHPPKADSTPTAQGATYTAPDHNVPNSSGLSPEVMALYGWEKGIPEVSIKVTPSKGAPKHTPAKGGGKKK